MSQAVCHRAEMSHHVCQKLWLDEIWLPGYMSVSGIPDSHWQLLQSFASKLRKAFLNHAHRQQLLCTQSLEFMDLLLCLFTGCCKSPPSICVALGPLKVVRITVRCHNVTQQPMTNKVFLQLQQLLKVLYYFNLTTMASNFYPQIMTYE